MKPKRFLAAKFFLPVVLAIGAVGGTPSWAGIPVIDAGNLTQNVMTALESVAQTLKQIEQYRTQLQQYENMLQNTAAPGAYVWDQAQRTMEGLRSSIDTLSYYRNQLGSVDAYLGNFQDVAYYRSSPCFSSTGCSSEQWAALRESQRLASESQKKANDALFKGLDKQQQAMEADARSLERLQASAQTSTGQMQALQNASMLASQQANQLLQIRGLLVAQQNVIATRAQAVTDREAKEDAARAQRFDLGSPANRARNRSY